MHLYNCKYIVYVYFMTTHILMWCQRHELSKCTTAPTRYKWVDKKNSVQCDPDAGEVYLLRSPGKSHADTPNVEECKKLCEKDRECRSITLFPSGWCSHFSTPCTETKKANKGSVSWTLIRDPGSLSNETPCTLALWVFGLNAHTLSILTTHKHARARTHTHTHTHTRPADTNPNA